MGAGGVVAELGVCVLDEFVWMEVLSLHLDCALAMTLTVLDRIWKRLKINFWLSMMHWRFLLIFLMSLPFAEQLGDSGCACLGGALDSEPGDKAFTAFSTSRCLH